MVQIPADGFKQKEEISLLIDSEMTQESAWQRCFNFLHLSENEWPIRHDIIANDLPGQTKRIILTMMCINKTLADRIDITRFRKYIRLIPVLPEF